MRGSAVITNLVITVIRGGSFSVILSVQHAWRRLLRALHVCHAWTQSGPTGTTDNSANGWALVQFIYRYDIRPTSMSTRLLPRMSWSFIFRRCNTPSSLAPRWRNSRSSQRAVRKRRVKLFTSDGYRTCQWLSTSCDLMSVYRIFTWIYLHTLYILKFILKFILNLYIKLILYIKILLYILKFLILI